MGQAPQRKIFTVVWIDRKNTFHVVDVDGYILSHSPDRSVAIELAIKDAKIVERMGARLSVYSRGANGKLYLEWKSK
jgi:hypothetical protein